MFIDVQEINKQLSRWAQAKQELTRQYEEYLKSIDTQIGLCHSMLAVVSTPFPAFDSDLIKGIAEGTRSAPTVVAAPTVAPTPVLEDEDTEEDEEDEEEDETPPVKSVTPAAKVVAVKVDTGRGGKPKLVDSMRYVLEVHGPLHPTDIAEKIIEHDLAPNSKNLVDYIRYSLSKNKSMFLKVVGQRGLWQSSSKGATTSPKAESSANAEELTAMSADDEIGEKLAEIQEIEAFRERERVGTIRLSPDEAKVVVDEMTDPRNLDKSDYSYVSSSV